MLLSAVVVRVQFWRSDQINRQKFTDISGSLFSYLTGYLSHFQYNNENIDSGHITAFKCLNDGLFVQLWAVVYYLVLQN